MRGKRPAVVLAYVRWFDSAVYKGSEYQPGDIDGYCEQETAGLLLKEEKDYVAVGLDRCTDTGNLRCVLCIPRANIREFRKVKV